MLHSVSISLRPARFVHLYLWASTAQRMDLETVLLFAHQLGALSPSCGTLSHGSASAVLAGAVLALFGRAFAALQLSLQPGRPPWNSQLGHLKPRNLADQIGLTWLMQDWEDVVCLFVCLFG